MKLPYTDYTTLFVDALRHAVQKVLVPGLVIWYGYQKFVLQNFKNIMLINLV